MPMKYNNNNNNNNNNKWGRGSTVAKVLRYNTEGSWFDYRWSYWNFSLT
jgi:hypothetical protein